MLFKISFRRNGFERARCYACQRFRYRSRQETSKFTFVCKHMQDLHKSEIRKLEKFQKLPDE